ncbi:MAG: hypothetical protein ACRYG8_23345 [Janthinobacterium lividum]
MNFDVTQFDTRTASEAGVAMPILHPRTGSPMLGADGNPVTITLLGPSSAVYKTMSRASQLRRADMSARGVKMTDEDFEADRETMLVALTKGWNFDTMGGQPFAFSQSNARSFYADKRWEWVTVAAWRFINEDGNYLPS